MPVKVIQSPSFAKRVNKFKKSQKEQLDKQIRLIIDDPKIGEEKKGDLKGVFVQKFKIDKLQYLLSYRFKKDLLELIMIGPHENYYRDLKSYLKHR
jgi:mRNA-degrading endonuclease RelE of RelBE toxin-antitoxin system